MFGMGLITSTHKFDETSRHSLRVHTYSFVSIKYDEFTNHITISRRTALLVDSLGDRPTIRFLLLR